MTLAPRSISLARRRVMVLLWLRRYADAITSAESTLRFEPGNSEILQSKVMGFLGLGDLAGARRAIAERPREIEVTDLVMNFGVYWDLMWVLDDERQQVLLGLPVEAFGGDAPSRALVFAQTYVVRGDATQARRWAQEAHEGFAFQSARNSSNAQLAIADGIVLAYLGRRDEAIREAERAMKMSAGDTYISGYARHQAVRVYTILGEREKALDLLEPLLAVPYYLSPAWLAVDPNFAPLKGHPRFERLLARK